jgi:CheY-like chemotaxis protein
MKKKLNCILLIDDNDADNYYHQTIIEQMNVTNSVQIVENGLDAINFLKKENQVIPELIFLDINMPKMNAYYFSQS